MIIHVAIEDEFGDDEETPGSIADADLQAELASEARHYDWTLRRQCDDGD